ncbi:MAG: hypothetical protein WKG00_25030 [Polyangiaceae bacterium]
MARWWAVFLVVTLALSVSPAWADEVETAGTLYDRGVQAQSKGDYARAASLFARADDLVPDPIALEAAIGAAALADDAPLAMSLVQRAGRASMPPRLASAVRAARKKHGARAGALHVRCDVCTVRIDGRPVKANLDNWVAVGPHRVEVTVGDALDTREVEVPGGGRVEIAGASGKVAVEPADTGDVEPPALGATDRRRRTVPHSGVAPTWFWVGVGATALFTGITVASGVDTLDRHAEFVADKTEDKAAAGQSAETRTYVLLGVTCGLGIGTAALGAFVVQWDAGAATVALQPAAGGAALSLRGAF